MNKDLQDYRMELWCKVWIAVANASNSTRAYNCTSWADEALKQFDERFKEDD